LLSEVQYVTGVTDAQIAQYQEESEACWKVLVEWSEKTQLFGFGQADWVYHKAAHFEKSSFKSIDTGRLQLWRYLLLAPSIIMTYNSVTTNEPLWFFYYLTHWGVNVSAFSIMATIVASSRREWQTTAMISTQCATALNLLIMVIFWFCLAPYVFPNLGWTGDDLYMRVHMVTLHMIPFVQTTINTIITDIELVEKDWPMMVAMGCFYMFANWMGKLDCGVAIYPVVDWEYPVWTFFGWLFLAFAMAAMYFVWARVHKMWRQHMRFDCNL